MMNATYTHPEKVLTSVRSASHNRFGAGARNCRSTRSAGRCWRSSEVVVTVNTLPASGSLKALGSHEPLAGCLDAMHRDQGVMRPALRPSDRGPGRRQVEY